MKLWLISRPITSVGYDEYDSFVVKAKDENNARLLASLRGSDSYCLPETWFDVSTVVTEIKISGKEEIILGSFNAG